MCYRGFHVVTILVVLALIWFSGMLPTSAEGSSVGQAPAGNRRQPVSIHSLSQAVSEFGRIRLSLDAMGTLGTVGTIHVEKPNKGKVRKAFLMAATTGFVQKRLSTGEVQLEGSNIIWGKEIPSSISSYNYWADVTSIVKPIVDAAPAGIVTLAITETDSLRTDGEVLAVVLDDPNQTTDNTIILYFGAQDINGDMFNIDLGSPIDKDDPNLILDFSLGISYGYQTGSAQYSIVDVNGKRLTTSAGGQDDGVGANGGLITVGGIGDSNDNPPDPDALPTQARSDDELYSLKPFVSDGDTSIRIDTSNPSNDDNILFAAIFLGATRSTTVVDLDISLHHNPTTPEARQPYENIIDYFADGVYESSNGSLKLGKITFHVSSANADTADIIWVEKCHPNGNVSGYGTDGMHINMCDVFENGAGSGSDYDFLSDDSHQKGAGYTLAHEWGHYYYSLYDEYIGDKSYDSTFNFPHSTDKAVKNSIMNSQWKALGGDNNWLNFSVSKNDTKETAQYRVYGACGWDTLVRPVSEDPQSDNRSALPVRLFHAELAKVAPDADEDATIDLPGTARNQVDIVWEPSSTNSLSLEGPADVPTYTAQLISIPGQNISYPEPMMLLAFVQQDLPLTGVGVKGSVLLPDETQRPVMFTDDGVAPDAVKGDGLYSVIIGYEMDGVYTIRVEFDNDAGSAERVAASFQPSVGINGEAVPLPPPVPISEGFSVSKDIQVLVSNATPDDYGNTPADAKVVIADDTPVPGKIEYAGDSDVFAFTVLDSGVTYVRMTNLALEMKPHLRVLGPDQTSVLFDASYPPRYGEYLVIPLWGMLPGTTVYAEVSDVSSSASGGLYEFSVGKKLVSDSDITAVTISGPTLGVVNTSYDFTTTLDPIFATMPITFTWQATGQMSRTHGGTLIDTQEFGWTEPGLQAITVTATNGWNTVTAVHELTIVVPLTAVTISGSTSGRIHEGYGFTVAITPVSATIPITYTWSPEPDSGQGTAEASYTWATGGEKVVVVHAGNVGSVVSATHTIAIAVPPESVAISGPTLGLVRESYDFAASVTPISTTTPITYTWSPEPDSGQGTAEAGYTWVTAGEKAITVSAENAGGAVTATHTIAIVVPPESVVISGPALGVVEESYDFTATVTPLSATTPITYTWSLEPQSGQGMAEASYAWATAGEKAITVRAENAGGVVSATHTITIVVPPEGVAISGPAQGVINSDYDFTASISPVTATMPLTYTWIPEPLNGQGPSQVRYTWTTEGEKAITVTVANAGGIVTGTHTIAIVVPPESVAISGPASGLVGESYDFAASVTPISATIPITCTWSPEPLSGQGTDQVRYTWETGGGKVISVTAANAGGMVTGTHTVTIVVPPESVAISGPGLGLVNESYDFAASVTPISTTTPITYTWSPEPDSGQGMAQARYAWVTDGEKTISVRAENAGSVVSATHTIIIVVPPESVIIDGPTYGVIGEPYRFSARVSPITATTPITYTWLPEPQGEQGTSEAFYTWTSIGSKMITVTVQNAGGTVIGTHSIAIGLRSFYLPLVLKSHR